MAIIRRGDLIQPKPGRPWALEVRIKPAPGQPSKRNRISTGCRDYQDALRVGADLKNQLLSGVHTWRKQIPTFAEWWMIYLLEFTKTAKSADTIAAKVAAGKILVPVFGKMLITQVNPQHCEHFRDAQLKEGYSKATVLARCAQMKAALGAAIQARTLTKNPWHKIPLPKANRRRRVLSYAEIQTLTAHLDTLITYSPFPRQQRDAMETRNYLTVALGTLLRIGTVLRITHAHLASLKTRGVFEIATKGGKVQTVRSWFVVGALESQAQLHPNSKRLFPIGEETLRGRLNRMIAATHVEHFTPHDLRRTAATRLMRGDKARGIAPIALPLLMELTGHSKIDTLVDTYTVAEEDAVGEALSGSASLLQLGMNTGTPEPPPATNTHKQST